MKVFVTTLTLLVVSTYAGEVLDLIEDCGEIPNWCNFKIDAIQNSFFSKGSTGAKITGLTFKGCDAKEVKECQAKKGTSVEGQLTFKSSVKTNSLKCDIHGKLGILPYVPYGCPVVDACSSLSKGNCPIEDGKEYVYDLKMEIKSWFPAVSKVQIL